MTICPIPTLILIGGWFYPFNSGGALKVSTGLIKIDIPIHSNYTFMITVYWCWIFEPVKARYKPCVLVFLLDIGRQCLSCGRIILNTNRLIWGINALECMVNSCQVMNMVYLCWHPNLTRLAQEKHLNILAEKLIKKILNLLYECKFSHKYFNLANLVLNQLKVLIQF